MSEGDFIDEEIEMHFSIKPGLPTSFTWRRKEYRITAVREMRRIVDLRRPWWRRRHRDYYLIETEQGETFEIYFHRGPGRRYWVLYRRVPEKSAGSS